MASRTTLHIDQPCHMRCAPRALNGPFPAPWVMEPCPEHVPLGGRGTPGSTPRPRLSPTVALAPSNTAPRLASRVECPLCPLWPRSQPWGGAWATLGRAHGALPAPPRGQPSACSTGAGPPHPLSCCYPQHYPWFYPSHCLYLSPHTRLPLPLPLSLIHVPPAHCPCLSTCPHPCTTWDKGREGGREGGMACPTALWISRPCHMKCTPLVPNKPSPRSLWAMPAPGGKGPHPRGALLVRTRPQRGRGGLYGPQNCRTEQVADFVLGIR